MSMNLKIKLIAQPIWQYLNQSLGDPHSVWSISQFKYLYQIELLETCWEKEIGSESSRHQ